MDLLVNLTTARRPGLTGYGAARGRDAANTGEGSDFICSINPRLSNPEYPFGVVRQNKSLALLMDYNHAASDQPSDYQLLKKVGESIHRLPDEPLGPVQDAFGTFLALWIECLEVGIDPKNFDIGLTLLSRADVNSAVSMRRATQESLGILP